MQIKSITNDAQWFKYLYRACKTDERVLAFMHLMLRTYPMGNWLHRLSTKGRKNKQIRLLVMCWDYYDSLTPERRYECFNRYFDTPLGKDHHFFWGYEHPKVK